MNKYLKGCLITLGIISLAIILIIIYIYYNISTSTERNEVDNIKCSNTQYILDSPTIQITDGIATQNIQKIKIILIQDSIKIDSVSIKNHLSDKIEFNFPFKNTNISCKIILNTERNQFLIENMNYFNDGKWGMLGYLGKDCQFRYDYKRIR